VCKIRKVANKFDICLTLVFKVYIQCLWIMFKFLLEYESFINLRAVSNFGMFSVVKGS